jgi:small-conductance mechanosensitive channel
MSEFLSQIAALGGSTLILVLLVAALYLCHRALLKRFAEKPTEQYQRQMIMLGLSLAGLVVAIIIMPVSDTMQGQLLSLLGVLLAATIALSSTTLVGNAMAGLMLKSLRKIRPGSYIRVGDHFGRVSEMDMLHTEIQTEDRDLTTLPNLFLVTHPVRVMRSSGTILSVEVSLAYDIPHRKVEECLLAAANATGLQDPFVQICELGDFSVTYRVAGLAEDLSALIETRRRLRAAILDALHDAEIEIVSPSFMNTRAYDSMARFIARSDHRAVASEETTPDEVVFDKAAEAASLEQLRETHAEARKTIEAIDAQVKDMEDGKERRSILFQKKRLEAQLAKLDGQIAQAEEKVSTE